VTFETVLVLAAALFAVGIYGVLSQMSVVMVMMGLELIINGAIVASVAFWRYLVPASAAGQVFAVVAFTVMAIEAAMGYGVLFVMFRRERGLVEEEADLKG
jgi:NAD(P)H-quinone oxidoreductase subunit 4L